MFRPPARDICLNALEDVYRTCKSPLPPLRPVYTLPQTNQASLLTDEREPDEESRPAAGKFLSKWRPGVIEQTQQEQQQQRQQQPQQKSLATRPAVPEPSNSIPPQQQQQPWPAT